MNRLILNRRGAIVSESDTAGVFQNRSVVDLGNRSEFSSLVNSFSIEAWIRPTELFRHQRIFTNTSDSDRRGFGFGVNDRSLAFTTFRKLDYITPQVLQNGNWYHVAVVFDASNDATFYVNGEQLAVIEGESPPDASNSSAYIGGLSRSESFHGSVDEVAIYDRPLTAETIKSHYLMGITDSGPVPIASDDIYTVQGGSQFETTVPQIPAPRYSFSDDFSSATLNPNLEDATAAFHVDDGVLKPLVDRQYVRTVKTDYLDGDFTFEVDVNLQTTKNTIEYVGIGPGVRGQVDEPADALYVRLHSVGFKGDIGVSANGPFGGISIGNINRPGTHRVRMTKTENQLLIEVDAFVDGGMQPNMSYWIGDIGTFAPFLNDTNSRLIIGGSTVSSFDNLRIDSSLDENGIAGLLQNDLLAGGDAKPVVSHGPEHGVLELRDDGMFSYTPNEEFSGDDSFSYFLDDGRNWSNQAKVTLRVNGVPTAVSDGYIVSEDGLLDARGPVIEIAQTGFNDQSGIGSDDTPNSPYRLDASIENQGNGEEDWYTSWDADPNISRVVSEVAFEGDGALHLRQTSNTYRTWYEPQSDLFTVQQHVRFTEDSRTIIGIYDGDDERCCRGKSGPYLGFFPDGSILALKDGAWLTAEIGWEPDRWYQLTTVIDVVNQSWQLFVDGVELLENETLDFRGEPTRLDSINYLSEVSGRGAYVDNVRIFSGNEIPGVLFNDSDANGDRLSAQLIDTTSHGTLAFDADGSFLYEPNENYFGTDSFTYRAIDEFGHSKLTTVTLEVEPANDPPVASDDEYDLGVHRTLSVASEAGLLSNDIDIDGDTLTAVLVEGPAHGQLTLNSDGSFQYTAEAGALTDQFTYQASDGVLISETHTVMIISHPPTIDVGNFALLPNTPNQEIEIFVRGAHPVSGFDLYAIIGDGGPERTSLDLEPGVDGPAITSIDLKTGTIFANSPDNARDLGSLPQIANWTISLADGGSIEADGLLATITVDTTGFLEGTWDLSLTNVLPEHPFGPFNTSFANWPIDTTNGFITVTSASVVQRHTFYNHSSWDGNDPEANEADDQAIAIDKVALLPGQKASFENYTSFSKGITGIMLDIADNPNSDAISLSDFEFRVGRNSDVSAWELAPTPQMNLRVGEGANGATRITFTWPDNAIQQQWLEVRAKSNVNTLLPSDEVFYFGNAVGETGNSATDSLVTSVDVIGTRDHQRGPFNPAPLTDVYDFNRDKIVSSIDVILARDNQVGFLTALPLITPENVGPIAAVAISSIIIWFRKMLIPFVLASQRPCRHGHQSGWNCESR